MVRDKLTRNLVSLFGGVYDEIDTAFKELIPANEKSKIKIFIFLVGGCANGALNRMGACSRHGSDADHRRPSQWTYLRWPSIVYVFHSIFDNSI